MSKNDILIKPFSDEFFKPAAELCRMSMEYDIMPDFLLREKTFGDPDYNSALTLLAFKKENEQPVGFIQGIIRSISTRKSHGRKIKMKKFGYIKLLCVHPDERRKGIASQLYKKAEKKLIHSGVKTIRVYESIPNYFMPGVDPMYTEAVCFFERNGFKKFGDTSNLSADLVNKNFSTDEEEKKLLKKDIIFKRAEPDEKNEVLNWLEKKFPEWIPEVSESFNNNPVSLFIAKANEDVQAFSAYEVNNKGTGWFGPMGTGKSFQGLGIGGILLKKCLLAMKEMGFKKAIIPWVGPIPFYMHYAGSKVERVFWRYEKILD
jgi:ribosomal protein S18 acetylase RimI-like enzyme